MRDLWNTLVLIVGTLAAAATLLVLACRMENWLDAGPRRATTGRGRRRGRPPRPLLRRPHPGPTEWRRFAAARARLSRRSTFSRTRAHGRRRSRAVPRVNATHGGEEKP